jgi:hypothetical protein
MKANKSQNIVALKWGGNCGGFPRGFPRLYLIVTGAAEAHLAMRAGEVLIEF